MRWMLAVLIGGAPAVSAAAIPEEPVRIAVVVSSNVGLPEEEPLSFADRDGRRVADVLVELGAFDDDDVFVVSDARPDDVTAALTRAVVRASTWQEAGRETLLLVYYTGHAASDGLHMHGEVLPLASLKTAARVVPATHRVFTIDACQSGQMFRSKGVRVLDVQPEPQAFVPPDDEAWITSSGPEELSFEQDGRGGALFTHYFVSGTRGAADVDADRRVTLGELFHFVSQQTSAAAAHLGQVQRPRWGGELDDLVLTELDRAEAGLQVRGPVASPVLLVRREDATVVAELPVGSGAFLALPSGRYQLVSFPRPGRPRVADVSLVAGRVERIDLAETLAEVRGVRAKGGLLVTNPWSLGFGYEAALGATPGGTTGHGAWVAVRRELGRGHHAGLLLSGLGGTFVSERLEGANRRVVGQAEWMVDVSRGDARIGPVVRLGAGWLHQEAARREDPTWGAWYGDATGTRATGLPVVDGRVGAFASFGLRDGLELQASVDFGAALVLTERVHTSATGATRLGMAWTF